VIAVGVKALVETDGGALVVPSSPLDWAQWVGASATRNYVLGDPLLNWLDLFGKEQGYLRDEELPAYDLRTDFTAFIFEQGRRFEDRVVRLLRSLTKVVTLANGPADTRDLSTAERTFSALVEGVPVIHQGVLRDPEHHTYGAPDLLVRSDVLRQLFPDAISESEAAVPAPDLGTAKWHYRVVDVKFTTLHLAAGGTLANQGSSPAYKVQLYIYNQALGRLQGIEPDASYLLGRGWEQTIKGVTLRGFSCVERLAPMPQSGTLAKSHTIADAATAACEWMRELRRDGAAWRILPDPTRPELYPNFGNQQDGPWHSAKRRIAEELEDLTLLWQVGVPGRKRGHAAGVFRWRDPRCTPAAVGVTGDKRPAVLQALLDMNRTTEGESIRPARIRAAEDEWRPEPALEFYVDFETVSDLADDFSRIPERGGQTLIFMIGCGHVEGGEWRFECFVADALAEKSEAEIIDSWLTHMEDVRKRLAPRDEAPRVIHWSPAEVSNFETAYNSARERHPDKDWVSPRWFDFLGRVVREEPVVVRGAMAFGLKAVAKALHEHGFIATHWGDGPADGLGAMVGAWWCQDESTRIEKTLPEIDLMGKIMQYNEVDCRVMMEAIRYLRQHH
jgi:hypothetical protein